MRRLTLLLAAVLCACALVAPAPSDAHTLTYRQAKRAAQRKADSIAHKRTRISSLIRITRHRYYAQATWRHTVPDGCIACGYDPLTDSFYDTPTTEYCLAELTVRFRSRHSGRVVAILESKSCF